MCWESCGKYTLLVGTKGGRRVGKGPAGGGVHSRGFGGFGGFGGRVVGSLTKLGMALHYGPWAK